ncbi:MAG TPA: NAD(P)/FAD-dependent oxidoreductase, partial [Flavisolibacter sp.]|nr:NAD(P)/FAD-dependent oxidoreductase [Flavisolibacter sp.]
MQENTKFDAIIIGGSYAGLSAAMALGRALRNVLIIDHKKPCNRYTPHSHNFITQDGEVPASIAAKARQQVAQYATVHFLDNEVIKASQFDTSFQVETIDGQAYVAKKLLFATGLKDLMPEISGFEACWGKSILHCPYCHGYEVKNQLTGVLSNGDIGFEFIKLIRNWTDNLVLITNGPSSINEEQRSLLSKHNIPIIEKPISSFEHNQGYIRHIIFSDQSTYEVKALYARPVFEQHSDLPVSLGCELTEQGLLKVDTLQKTNVKGIFAAGDNSSLFRSVSFAVSTGTMAGAALNKEL